MEPRNPCARILVQPYEASRFLREDRSNQGENCYILGVNSTVLDKTYPKIEVLNYVGMVKIRVSCVSTDPPHKPHPNKLVGNNCSDGVYTVQCDITEVNRVWELRNVGIQCVSRNSTESLELREWMRVDPFRTGFRAEPMSFHRVRLGIEVFYADAGGRLRHPMRPMATDQISAFVPSLVITYVSHSSGPATGGTRLAFFTEKLPLAQLHVRFSEESTGWQVEVPVLTIHKMCAVVVIVPPYRDINTRIPALVKVQLCRSPVGHEVIDGYSESSPVDFEYEPVWRSISRSQGAKKRRVDEKELRPSLFRDIIDTSSTSGSSVENQFRTPGDSHSTMASNTSTLTWFSSPNSTTEDHVRQCAQSSQMGPSSGREQSPQMGQSPKMEQPAHQGQSSRVEHQPRVLLNETPAHASEPSRSDPSNPTAKHYDQGQHAQSSQMGPSSGREQSPQMGQPPKMGQPPHQGQSSKVEHQPRVSHNEMPAHASEPSRSGSSEPTAKHYDEGQHARSPQMVQLPQVGESRQMAINVHLQLNENFERVSGAETINAMLVIDGSFEKLKLESSEEL